MADLMFPILIILIMFMMIESLESKFILVGIGVLFMPISFLFLMDIHDYDSLFNVSITAYKNNIVYSGAVGGSMTLVPLLAFLKLVWLKGGWGEGFDISKHNQEMKQEDDTF